MSKIEWTEKTWNPVTGCNKVSQGCKLCYAEVMHRRLQSMGLEKYSQPFDGGARLSAADLALPLSWRTPRRIFVNSMSDLFHKDLTNEEIAQVFAVMALCQVSGMEHQFQVLTKRAARMKQWFCWVQAQREAGRSILAFLPDDIKYGAYGKLLLFMASKVHSAGGAAALGSYAAPWPLRNVWLGVSVEDQATADERIPHLLRCPARVRWLSMEPLLGPVDLGRWLVEHMPVTHPYEDAPGGAVVDGMKRDEDTFLTEDDRWERVDYLHWVVVGGESGSKARPMHPAWARMVRDQCVETRTPFLFKQWGRWRALGEGDDRSEKAQWVEFDGRVLSLHDPEAEWPVLMDPVGKKRSGRVLDGRTWDEYPDA